MFAKNSIEAALEKEITTQLEKLSQAEEAADRGAILDHVTKLQKLKSESSSGLKPPSMDTVLVVGANIFGILWLARYEQEHVIKAQKALGFVMKPR